MDIDKLILLWCTAMRRCSFSSLMDIDKLIQTQSISTGTYSFSSLMDIDKLIHHGKPDTQGKVLVL